MLVRSEGLSRRRFTRDSERMSNVKKTRSKPKRGKPKRNVRLVIPKKVLTEVLHRLFQIEMVTSNIANELYKREYRRVWMFVHKGGNDGQSLGAERVIGISEANCWDNALTFFGENYTKENLRQQGWCPVPVTVLL